MPIVRMESSFRSFATRMAGNSVPQRTRPPRQSPATPNASPCSSRSAIILASNTIWRREERARSSDNRARERSHLESADCGAEDAHIIAAGNLAGLFGREAALQHRRDELHPLGVILEDARSGLLIGADAHMIDPDDVDHFLQAVDIFFQARKEVPDADRASGFGNR